MNRAEMKALEVTLVSHRQKVLARAVREMPARLERTLSTKATELSTQALGAVVARLEGFKKELAAAIAKLPEHAQTTAREQHRELERILSDRVGKQLDASLTKLTRDCRAALESDSAKAAATLEKKCLETEAAFAKSLERLAADHERKRLELAEEFEAAKGKLVKTFEAKQVTPILADTYRGNWQADVTYRRGETFSFRGGWHLVLRDSLGRPPGNATLKGPAPAYALLAAPGAPGVNTTTGSSGGGSGNYVTPPLVPASALQGQWTFSSGYMYWAVANGVVIRWAVTPAP